MEVLLKHGVDTKAQATYDLTAVQIALKNQHFEIQNLLSDHEERLVHLSFTVACVPQSVEFKLLSRTWHLFRV